MDYTQLADVFFKELRKVIDIQDKELRFSLLYRTVNTFFNGLTRSEKIQFTTIFSKISFVFHKYDVTGDVQWQMHEFRKEGRKIIFQNKPIKPYLFELGLSASCKSISEICRVNIPEVFVPFFQEAESYDKTPIVVQEHIAKARVVVVDIQEDERLLTCYDELRPQVLVKVRYDETSMNEHYRTSIELLRKVWREYTTLNLLDISVDENGIYYPKIFIIEPDYLIDVSAIANCFGSPTESILYLVKKFMPIDNSIPLVVGNIANHFLDELMNDDSITFKESFPKVFKNNPLTFSLFTNEEVREIMNKSKLHFHNLFKMIRTDFKENDINPKDCYLEPSFFSERYGIQGRLDIWYKNPASAQNSAIVELKSGSAFMPNRYGISDSHYVQALLYDLLIKSVFEQDDPRNYILYSKESTNNLRFAPVLDTKQNEALSVRNEIVSYEQMLVNMHQQEDKDFTILDRITPERFPNIRGFNGRDIQKFSLVMNGLNDLERQYFLSFVSFIAREHQLSKMGIQGNESVNGLASLWLNSYDEKNDSFDILSDLTVVANYANNDTPTIYFERNENTNKLANFRVGDIAILYASNTPNIGETVLNAQIFKCSIIEIDNNQVAVKLRFKQFNNEIFEQKTQKWVLEHDQMDHSYTAMYRSLFAFVQRKEAKKSLLFTSRPPQKGVMTDEFESKISQLKGIKSMTEEQQFVLRKALAAPEYFLLWGPPGTGKTSVMLKTMVEFLYHQTDENILLLAYTNRAVDEICEAIEAVSPEAQSNYIRIGSEYSSGKHSHHALFSNKIESVNNRKELKVIIDNHRIFVATVASIQSRQELLELKQFNRVIIDEASQILEPMLVGLLSNFDKLVLIGDHKQLPAVVQQDKAFSKIKDDALQAIGLRDMRDSLFERLFLRCKNENWNWAFDMLSHQGRMHYDIMDFPNRFFYENNLKILPQDCGVNQSDKPVYNIVQEDILYTKLAQNRVLYFDTPVEDNPQNKKINVYEAEKIAEVLDSYYRLYKDNNRVIDFQKSIGIITPYRAQIVQIKNALEAKNIDYGKFTIDTVERYQGGARDIILISLCLNDFSQLEKLVSLDTEGKVDRKLNVALTRAKQHLVIIGNKSLMQKGSIYSKLLGWATQF